MIKTKTSSKKTDTKKTLYERYSDMHRKEQKAFRAFCIENIRVTPKTIYNWISGNNTPGTLEQLAIASFLKTTASQIWF